MSKSTSSVVVGNVYDKYTTRNGVARWLMRRFLEAVSDLYLGRRPRRVLEVGCGEGLLAQHLISLPHKPDAFHACDLSLSALAPNLDERLTFSEADIYNLPFQKASFDLVVCCEVVEHLEDPARGLAEICRVSEGAVIVSTPQEPLWRVLNLLRAKYWGTMGNTPGHVQHFSQASLLRLLGASLEVSKLRTPIPWTLVLGRVRMETVRPVRGATNT